MYISDDALTTGEEAPDPSAAIENPYQSNHNVLQKQSIGTKLFLMDLAETL